MLPNIINIIQCLASHLSLQEFNILIMVMPDECKDHRLV